MRQIHPRAHVGYRHQYLGHLSVDPHPVKIELQIARLELPVADIEMHLHLAQGIDRLDQFLVGAFGPENFDELERGRESSFRYDILKKALEGESGKVLALEQGAQ